MNNFQVCDDPILWKRLLSRDFKTKINFTQKESICWKDEYIRLVDRVPKIHCQVSNNSPFINEKMTHDYISIDPLCSSRWGASCNIF